MVTQISAPSERGSRPIIRRSPRLAGKARTSLTPAALGSTAPDWHLLAECKTVPATTFYGSSDTQPMTRAEVAAARRVCAACPVRRDCLADALAAGDTWGVWGGLTSPERDRALAMFHGHSPHVMGAFDAGILEPLVRKL
jgi:hypothetical protein